MHTRTHGFPIKYVILKLNNKINLELIITSWRGHCFGFYVRRNARSANVVCVCVCLDHWTGRSNFTMDHTQTQDSFVHMLPELNIHLELISHMDVPF